MASDSDHTFYDVTGPHHIESLTSVGDRVLRKKDQQSGKDGRKSKKHGRKPDRQDEGQVDPAGVDNNNSQDEGHIDFCA